MTPLLLVGVLACAARQQPVETTDPPPWSTTEGREAARDELAAMLLEQGSPEAALQVISRARAAGDGGTDLDLLQGKALARAGLSDDAIPWFEGIPKRAREYGEARNELGLIYMERHDQDLAIAMFQGAVKFDEHNSRYLNNLGFALMSAGRHAEAIEPLRAAVAEDGGQPRTRNNLGFALVAVGRDEEALRAFRAAGREADAAYNLALGIELRGSPADAIPWYERALSVDPDHHAARAALGRLHESKIPSQTPDQESP